MDNSMNGGDILKEVKSMKRTYKAPELMFVPFNHEERIATSGTQCRKIWNNIGDSSCASGEPEFLGWFGLNG